VKRHNPEWKEFEIAVADFLSALDPSAHVTHDVILPDQDTGEPRQRDVWIETTVLNYFSVKVLVSCKKYKRKLDQGHIDHFIGELRSSGAQKGVIYSYAGYTNQAIKKAEKLGISCCRLYKKERPDIPDALIFDAYLLTPGFQFQAVKLNDVSSLPNTISDLLNLVLPDEETKSNTKLIDIIEKLYFSRRQEIREHARRSGDIPPDWSDNFIINDDTTGTQCIYVEFGGCWHKHKGKLEGYLVDGSYSFTENKFVGRQSYPGISERGPNPGSHWQPIHELPKDINKLSIVGVLYGGKVDIRGALAEYGSREIKLIEDPCFRGP